MGPTTTTFNHHLQPPPTTTSYNHHLRPPTTTTTYNHHQQPPPTTTTNNHRQFFTSWGVDVLVTRFHVYMKFCAVDDFMHAFHVFMNRSYHNHRIFSHNSM